MEVSIERAEALGLTIRKVFKDKIEVLVEKDPQYIALKRIYLASGSRAVVLVAIANSLISYHLTGSGEEYWSEVGDFFSKRSIGSPSDLYRLFNYFLKHTRYNKRFTYVKIKRLERFLLSWLAEKVFREPCIYSVEQYPLLKELAKNMGQGIYSKTIVFAAKMYYYAVKLSCSKSSPDPRVPMPIDRRVAAISLLSGLASPASSSRALRYLIEEAMKPRNRDKLVRAWFMVSDYSGIPCILLDTIVWLLGKYVLRYSNIEDMAKAFHRDYGELVPGTGLSDIFTQFTYTLHTA